MGYGIYSNRHFPSTPDNKFSSAQPRFGFFPHTPAANDYQFPVSLVVSGMPGLPGDGITLWSWRPLCDQSPLVRSLNNYSLVTTSWAPGHLVTASLDAQYSAHVTSLPCCHSVSWAVKHQTIMTWFASCQSIRTFCLDQVVYIVNKIRYCLIETYLLILLHCITWVYFAL